MLQAAELQALRTLTPDGRLLFSTRVVRLFAYGFVAVVLALYLKELGFEDSQIGLTLTLTLIGDAVISLWLATIADRIGRRRVLIAGAVMMMVAGLVFALTGEPVLVTLAAILGVISPSGNEVGPFLALEQASLTQTIPAEERTRIFAWYNLIGSAATACGSLGGGLLAGTAQRAGLPALDSYRLILVGYALLGAVLALRFRHLSPRVEAPRHAVTGEHTRLGLHRSRRVVFRLSLLFMVDAFAGGLVVQSLVAYWFNTRFGVGDELLGGIFFATHILAGISALAAARLAARIGLINTMVWTHIPSNLLLISVPLMPTLGLAILALLARACLSQMDVPTRQSYVMAVVDPDERSAAAGVTSIVRTFASSGSPLLTGLLLAGTWLGAPFIIAGGLKIIYDLALYRSFRTIKPPEEQAQA